MEQPAVRLGAQQMLADIERADDVGLEGEQRVAFHQADRNHGRKVEEVTAALLLEPGRDRGFIVDIPGIGGDRYALTLQSRHQDAAEQAARSGQADAVFPERRQIGALRNKRGTRKGVDRVHLELSCRHPSIRFTSRTIVSSGSGRA